MVEEEETKMTTDGLKTEKASWCDPFILLAPQAATLLVNSWMNKVKTKQTNNGRFNNESLKLITKNLHYS